MMYDDLVKRLRRCEQFRCRECEYEQVMGCRAKLNEEAADAIEELTGFVQEAERDRDEYRERLDKANDAIEELNKLKWIPFETRPMDEEERQYYSKQYGFGLADDEAVIYCSEMPDHGQEVLVCNKYGQIWIDTFDDDPDYGVGFETNGDMDGLVAWMLLPKPYEPPKEET